MKSGDRKKQKAKTGPKEQRLKLKGDWQVLVGKALAKPRPKRAWSKAKGKKP